MFILTALKYTVSSRQCLSTAITPVTIHPV
jgi:hypothetical protein